MAAAGAEAVPVVVLAAERELVAVVGEPGGLAGAALAAEGGHLEAVLAVPRRLALRVETVPDDPLVGERLPVLLDDRVDGLAALLGDDVDADVGRAIGLEQVVEGDVLLAVEVGGLRLRLGPSYREAVDGPDRVLGLDLDLVGRLRLRAVAGDDDDLAAGRAGRNLRGDGLGADRGGLDLDPAVGARELHLGDVLERLAGDLHATGLGHGPDVEAAIAADDVLDLRRVRRADAAVAARDGDPAQQGGERREGGEADDPRRGRSRARGAWAQVLLLFRSGLRG